jgi:hypothetical protein
MSFPLPTRAYNIEMLRRPPELGSVKQMAYGILH